MQARREQNPLAAARALLILGRLNNWKPGMAPSSERITMSTDRDEAITNARAKHLRKHPKEAEAGVGEKPEKVAVKGPATKVAGKTGKDAVIPPKSS